MRLQESGVDEAGEGKGTQRLSRLAFLGLLCLLPASFLHVCTYHNKMCFILVRQDVRK